MVFTQFLEFVEVTRGADVVDDIIEDSQVASGGAYTAVGTYPADEMVSLVSTLSQHLDVKVPELLRQFGHHLGKTFATAFPQYFDAADDLFDFLGNVDSRIHIEVRKLYPDAELPSFIVQARTPKSITLDYRSPRCLESLATGLIECAAAHFSEPVEIQQQVVETADRRVVRFEVTHV